MLPNPAPAARLSVTPTDKSLWPRGAAAYACPQRMADPRDTPAMRQFYRFKKAHPDCVLLFRIGDFYETFDDDAVTISRALGLTLTQRAEGVPMAGMPFHQIDPYVRRLIDKGYRVAVCDQIEEPAEAKARGGAGAIIERAVTRVLTPGTLVDESLLQPEAQATLAAVCYPDGGERADSPVSAAVVDLSTGRFILLDSTVAAIGDELLRRHVSELLFSSPSDGTPPNRVKSVLNALSISGTGRPAWHFRPNESLEILKDVYGVQSLGGFGLRDDDPAIPAAGAVLRYLQTTQPGDDEAGALRGVAAAAPEVVRGSADVLARVQPNAQGSTASGGGTSKRPRATLSHLQPPRREDPSGFCILDATSLRSLEVLTTIRAAGGGRTNENAAGLDGSLAGIFATSRSFAGCRTAMGKRLVRDWLCRPLRDLAQIQARQRCVLTLIEDRQTAARLSAALGEVQDVSRIAGRIALARATPRDLVALGKSLAQVTMVAESIDNAPAFAASRQMLLSIAESLAPLAAEIGRTCVDSPPMHLREGGLVREGVDAELDEARLLQRDAATWMAEYQARLIQEHDLPSLKVGYNKIFGYYIELPAGQARRAPDAFSRKQTLKNAERYVTPELREFESKVSTAEARANERELLIFNRLCAEAATKVRPINTFADTVAELDTLACFAEKAAKRRWVCPEMTEEAVLTIRQGRHPVLDELLDTNFVPNDLDLGEVKDGERGSLALITGPNMAGKSTYIRQTALLVLLAHAGCFVPAESALVGITDRIFTRVGADDALHAGQSTFMVEMTETSRILNHATGRSLVVLDEIGRGTSTLDGLSLAWAIAETLAGERLSADEPRTRKGGGDSRGRTDSAALAPRTLFATHYHELTDLEEMLQGRVRNLHVAVREWGDDIIFLHRILPGRTDQSYGIHVAKLAGMPGGTIARAKHVLESLAVHHGLGSSVSGASSGNAASASRANGQSRAPAPPPSNGQLGLFTEYVSHPAVDALRELKLDALTPLQAFDELRRLQQSVTSASPA